MNPSDIILDSTMPLSGTFGRVEAEAAAAILIATLAATGDTWRPVNIAEYKHEFVKPFPWATNTFARPSIHEIVSRGFATLSKDGKTAELTEEALDVLRRSRWNRSRKVGGT